MLKYTNKDCQILSNTCKTGKNWITLPKTPISMVIERAPEINEGELFKAIISPQDRQIEDIVE